MVGYDDYSERSRLRDTGKVRVQVVGYRFYYQGLFYGGRGRPAAFLPTGERITVWCDDNRQLTGEA